MYINGAATTNRTGELLRWCNQIVDASNKHGDSVPLKKFERKSSADDKMKSNLPAAAYDVIRLKACRTL